MSRNNVVSTGGAWLTDTGSLPSRAVADLYVTPRSAVDVAYEFLKEQAPEFVCKDVLENRGSRNWHLLDLGAGPGVWGEAARARWPSAFIHGVELRSVSANPAYNEWSTMDMQEWQAYYADARIRPFDLVVGNPPYSLDEEAVRIGLERLRDGGWALFLLPITFLTSQSRRDGLFKEYPLYAYAQYSQRISWTDNGKTPPRDHGLYLFRRGWSGSWTGHFLPNTTNRASRFDETRAAPINCERDTLNIL